MVLEMKIKLQWINMYTLLIFIMDNQDFPGGTVDKKPPANAGDMGLIPGPGIFHTPRSN